MLRRNITSASKPTIRETNSSPLWAISQSSPGEASSPVADAEEITTGCAMAIDAVSDARAAAPGHIWELDLPDEPVEITGDAARLHQVLANLLANARTHTPPGTRVTTLIRPGSPEDPARSDVITLAVRDDGPGIPQSLQRNVFERFTRGDEARNRASGSTGLGLSIVAAVTSAHAGRVGVRSQPGETTFLVELPVAG